LEKERSHLNYSSNKTFINEKPNNKFLLLILLIAKLKNYST